MGNNCSNVDQPIQQQQLRPRPRPRPPPQQQRLEPQTQLQPQPSELPKTDHPKTSPQKQNSEEFIEINYDQPIYIHEKYEELTFNEIGLLDRPKYSISPSDLFYISICYPKYCYSIHDMIRQAIRTESIRRARDQSDYLNNFLFSENMNYNRTKILDRTFFRHKLRSFLKNAYSLALPYKNDDEDEQHNEINFQEILSLLKSKWARTNKETINILIHNFHNLTGSSVTNYIQEDILHQIFSQIMGTDDCEAFVPHQNLIWKDIDSNYINIKEKLSTTKPRCCMTFSPTESFNSIEIKGTILEHGICSNGKFLFLLMKEKKLNIYLIYKGLIHHLIAKFNFKNDKLKLDDSSYMFCSQKWLFLKDDNNVYQVPIIDLIYENQFQFKKTNRSELQNTIKAFSDGVTYSIINSDNKFKTFDAETDKLIMTNENHQLLYLLNVLPTIIPIITNGMLVGFLLQEVMLMLSTYLPNEQLVFKSENCFPNDNNSSVFTATIDSLLNIYFSATINEENTKIFSHPYTGAPNSYLFGLKMTENLQNDSIGSLLLKFLLPCAFSPTIPENLIISSNQIETDLLSITKWIDANLNDHDLVKGLLILLDLNFKKYESKTVAAKFLPTVINMLSNSHYKRLASTFLINNFDIFFDVINYDVFAYLIQIFDHPPNGNGTIFNEWVLNKLSHSSLLSKININEDFFCTLFTNEWPKKSRSDEINLWIVDLLLIAQENLFEETSEILKKDPLDLEESELINSICNYAQILITHFVAILRQTITDNPIKSDRFIDYDSILYTLISNFFALAAPVTECSQIANAFTNEDSQEIIKLLNDEFDSDEKLQLFIGYFDMIYTTSISSLIRGGSAYPLENDYKWLIHGNFHSGDRNLTPPDLSQSRFFISSIQHELITNGSEKLNYLYQNLSFFRLVREEHGFIDPFLMAAVTHQTNTLDLLSVRNENNQISRELITICRWVTKLRNRYFNIRQHDNSENENIPKQSDKYLANIGILIILNPVLTDYLEKADPERSQYLRLLEQFIQNNDPYQFHKLLKAVPAQIENVLNGFDKLNSLFQTIQNESFQRIIIDGISRVDSFERLGYLLSHAELDEHALSTLAIFSLSCFSLIHNSNQITILEILYTVLATCKNFKEKAIDVMNQLSVYVDPENCLSDPFFMTVAGLSFSTSAIPHSLEIFPLLAKSCIIQLVFAKQDSPTLTVIEIFDCILNEAKTKIIFNSIWIKMLFTIFTKCENDENETLNELLNNIFTTVSEILNDNCLVFNTLPDIIYGFRSILNLKNDLSIFLQTLLATITVESSIGEIFLLLAITAGDISDFSMFYAIRNRHGKWLKYYMKNEAYYLPIPITPLCKCMQFDINEITDPVQDIELNLEMGLSFETILAFNDICIKDQGSFLFRMYLQALSKYVLDMNMKIPEDILSNLAKSAIPYIDFHILSNSQTNYYQSMSNSFPFSGTVLPEFDYGLGLVQQTEWVHLFAYNILKLGIISINAIILDHGYIVIHKQEPIIIEVPSGTYNGGVIGIENGAIQINVIDDQSLIIVNENIFPSEKDAYIEFIVSSVDSIIFQMDNHFNFTNPQIYFNDINNSSIPYLNDTFENENYINDFEENLDLLVPVKFKLSEAKQYERTEKNIIYNKNIDKYCFNDKLPFNGTASMHSIISKKNEFCICNQLKSVILAQAAIKDTQSLDWPTSFSLIKSAVVAVGGLNRSKLMEGNFPYSLEKGFFSNCSLNSIQSSNVQIFFIAIKALLKSDDFMNNLGNQLIIMAQDRSYHSLLHKKDLIIIQSTDFDSYKKTENDFLINFDDDSKGIIRIDDSGSWIIDTPIVFLLLLWIFIDNCKTSEQRICAKLALVDCILIKSPLIKKYMPEFLSYTQNTLLFSPDDFNPIYIHHLSTLALNNQNNSHILCFYESEKKCHKMKDILQSISSQPFNINGIKNVDFDLMRQQNTPILMHELIQLLKKYKSVDDFPVWYFLPIWKTISLYTYEKYSDDSACEINDNHANIYNHIENNILCTFILLDSNTNNIKVLDIDFIENEKRVDLDHVKGEYLGYYVLSPNERKRFVWNCKNNTKVKIQMYKITPNDNLNHENLKNDIKSFAVDWTDSDTENLLLQCSDTYLQCKSFIWTFLSAHNMTDLVNKFGVHIVQFKLAYIFMFDSYYKIYSQFDTNYLSPNDDEMRRMGRENSRFFSFQNRFDQFYILTKAEDMQRAMFINIRMTSFAGRLVLDGDLALKFLNGQSNDYHDSMIYQLIKPIKQDILNRFMNIVWGVHFKGRDAIDASGVTNETITIAVNSFICQKTGICILSPNITENVSNSPNISSINENEMGDILIIPYPTLNDPCIYDMLYAFGVILGSIIRIGLTQDIPFPLFIWNYLAGKPISKNDVYENDTRLKDEIDLMKNGTIDDHKWTYRDWNNMIKPIVGFPNDKIVSQDLVEIYETIVIDLRIKSLEKYLVEIKKGLYSNQRITDTSFLSGGLINFLCQGKKDLDIPEIIKRLVFKDETDQLKNNLITVLNEYDQKMMKKFLKFTTAKPRPPNFSVVPNYCILVRFCASMNVSGLPLSHTCFNQLDIPLYPTLEIMREKINYAIENCIGMDIS